MKIGFFTDSYLPMRDGVTTSVETCARALEQRGHEIYIIAPRQPGYKDKRKNIYRLTSIKFVNTPEVRWALQLPEKSLLQVFKIDFNIIHGHSGGGVTLIGLQIARAKGIPYVGTYHTLFSHYTHYFFNGKIIRPRMIELTSKFIGNLCDYLIAPTERVKKELISYGVTKPINVLPNGIDVENYKNVEKGFLRKKTKISHDKKILLYIGRLGKEKSVDFLIQTFKLIHEHHHNTALVIVGDGPEKQNLKNIAETLHLNGDVYFLGEIAHITIPKVYADADVFVFASQTETQGMVILEAFASGLPVVAVDDDVFKNVIESNKNGYLVKKDTGEFAKKVLHIITNKIIYKKFSHQASQSASKFSVETTAFYLEKLYEKLIEEKEKNLKMKKIQRISVRQFKQFVSRVKDELTNLFEI